MIGDRSDRDETASQDDDYASVVDVDRSDDIAAICGRVDAAPTLAVVVNARRGNRDLSTELGMRRLSRHAEESGKAVAIATRSRAVASRARQMAIPVARNPESIRWDLPGRHVVGAFGRTIGLPRAGRFVQLAVILAVVAVLVVLALTMAPGATVTAFPPVETLTRVVQVTASRDLQSGDYAKLTVPARQVSTTETLTVPIKVTGHTRVGTVAATASVVIKNPGAQAITIPGGAILTTADGSQTFALNTDAVVAPGASVTAGATAMKLGTGGNVKAGAISALLDSKYSALSVSNPSAAVGGTDADGPAVADADLQAARQLGQSLGDSSSVRALLARDHPHEAIFPETAVTSVEVGKLPATGTPMDVLLVTVTVKVTAVAIMESDLNGLASEVLAPESSQGQFINGTVGASEVAPATVNGAVITALLQLHGDFARNVTSGAIRNAVQGKSKTAARSTLANQYGIQNADINLTPGWAPWLPRFGFRISVNLREATPGALPASESTALNGRSSPAPAVTPTASGR